VLTQAMFCKRIALSDNSSRGGSTFRLGNTGTDPPLKVKGTEFAARNKTLTSNPLGYRYAVTPSGHSKRPYQNLR